MIEQTIYIATDKTVFEDKDECLRYEIFLKNYDRVVKLTDAGEVACTPFDTYYVYLATPEIVQAFLEGEQKDGYSIEGISEPGFYMWNENKFSYTLIDCFVNDLVKKSQDIKNKMISLYIKSSLSEDVDANDEIY